MAEVIGLVESAEGVMMSRWGAQLALLGGVALFLGALRLHAANRTRGRGILLAGLFLFALGGTLQSLEHLGLLQLDYYPGWKADFEQVLLEDHAEMEFSDGDLPGGDPRAQWWEGPVWWGQRLGLMIGAGLAAVGFVVEGRRERRPAARKPKRAKKGAAR